jgi:hypothetical protein
MVIAVIAMGMVQGSLVEIILMISMGNELMPAVLMPTSAGDRCARWGILVIYLKHMLIVMSPMWGMKMPLMHVIDVTIMGNRNMPTMLSMNMVMLIVSGMVHMNVPFKEMNMSFLFQSIAQKTGKIN